MSDRPWQPRTLTPTLLLDLVLLGLHWTHGDPPGRIDFKRGWSTVGSAIRVLRIGGLLSAKHVREIKASSAVARLFNRHTELSHLTFDVPLDVLRKSPRWLYSPVDMGGGRASFGMWIERGKVYLTEAGAVRAQSREDCMASLVTRADYMAERSRQAEQRPDQGSRAEGAMFGEYWKRIREEDDNG